MIESNCTSICCKRNNSSATIQKCHAAGLCSSFANGWNYNNQDPGISNDDEAALDIVRQFGAVVSKKGSEMIIDSSNSFLFADTTKEKELEINCGESGLSIRMFTPIAALSKQPVRIVGSGSLSKRPMNFFDEILPKLGVEIYSQNGHIPLHIQGPLRPGNITINGSLSSQFLTGLLMAYAAANASDVTIEVIDLKSRPYIDLTLSVMQSFGLAVPLNYDYQQFYFPKSSEQKKEQLINYQVEGDWSGGAFLLVAGAIGGTVITTGLDIDSTQADKKIIEALRDCGATIKITDDAITLTQSQLLPFTFDATDCPDLFPPLVALAAYCSGTTIIKGVSRLAHKESNRAITLQEQFGKLGVEILLQDNEMIVSGTGSINGGRVHSCHDHRIAMACAVAALGATGPVEIEEAEAISKSYPEFYKHLQDLSANVEILHD